MQYEFRKFSVSGCLGQAFVSVANVPFGLEQESAQQVMENVRLELGHGWELARVLGSVPPELQ
jgi:hypothetical protein